MELISNGILLDEAMADRLAAAGLDRLWVSIDGASPQSYADVRLGDHLPEIIANLERLKARSDKPELGISFVAMKRNIADLPAVIDLAQRLGASHFSLSNVEPYTEDMAAEILYGQVLFAELPEGGCVMPRFDPGAIDVQTLRRVVRPFPLDPFLHAAGAGTQGALPLPAAPQRQRALGRPHRPLPAAAPCPHGLLERPYRAPGPISPSAPCANADWAKSGTHPEYRAFRRKLDEFAFAPCTTCNSCDLPDINNEDCFGNVHPACGGCLWSQGFIQCP